MLLEESVDEETVFTSGNLLLDKLTVVSKPMIRLGDGLIVVVVDWKCFYWKENVPMWNELTLEGEIVWNPSVSHRKEKI
ncbi:hypothetical protein LR48_Vigan03g308600 [Vigna angularis]|uniref:Uncharacterized protein n=1 Tax=Phaseolus angularis TaxID=3914 RepID=A0A0L9UAZ7_PHAAN|nr:hypothetical protein LR48_Vigan03g308600 [Vigna angularis]